MLKHRGETGNYKAHTIWNIEQCNTKTNHKIDLSNEDHCGPCGQYALTKIEIQMNKDRKSDVEK